MSPQVMTILRSFELNGLQDHNTTIFFLQVKSRIIRLLKTSKEISPNKVNKKSITKLLSQCEKKGSLLGEEEIYFVSKSHLSPPPPQS